MPGLLQPGATVADETTLPDVLRWSLKTQKPSSTPCAREQRISTRLALALPSVSGCVTDSTNSRRMSIAQSRECHAPKDFVQTGRRVHSSASVPRWRALQQLPEDLYAEVKGLSVKIRYPLIRGQATASKPEQIPDEPCAQTCRQVS